MTNNKQIVCKRAEECTYHNCRFVHPEGWTPTIVQCKNALGCNRPKCIFEHPTGWAPVAVECRNGLKCGRSKCIFDHPDGWNWRNNMSDETNQMDVFPSRNQRYTQNTRADRFMNTKTDDSSWKKNIDCRDSGNCQNDKCGFNHPEGEKKSVVRECKYGVDCKSGRCLFNHPRGWNPHKDTDCKNSLECANARCRFKHPEGWEKPQEEKVCRFGSSCKNKTTTCKFKHVSQKRVIDI